MPIRKGLKSFNLGLRQDQYFALYQLALDKIADNCGGPLDISGVIRGIIDLYLDSQKPTKKRA